jgi:hypothetical protein
MSRRARPREPCARSPQTRRPAQPSSAHSRSPTLNPRNGRSRIARKKQSRPVSHQCRLPESSPTPRATDIESPVCPSMRPVARIRSAPARARPLSASKRCCGARIGRRTLPLPRRLATAMRSPVPGGAACAVDRLGTTARGSCVGSPPHAPVKRRSFEPPQRRVGPRPTRRSRTPPRSPARRPTPTSPPGPLLDDRHRHQRQSRPPVADHANRGSRSRPLSSINRGTGIKHHPRQDTHATAAP